MGAYEGVGVHLHIVFCYRYRTPFYFWKTATEGLYGVKGIFGHFHPRKNVVYVRSCIPPVIRCSDDLVLFYKNNPIQKFPKCIKNISKAQKTNINRFKVAKWQI